MATEIPENTAILVPAYNAAQHLPGLATALAPHVPLGRVIAVDDGSADNTEALARDAGFDVVVHAVNRGKGMALRTGMAHARQRGFEFVITLDADLQHDPGELADFVKRQADSGADIVVGNRLENPEGMPGLRLWTNRVTSRIVSILARARIPDSQNGYRMIRLTILDKVQLETDRYDTESEILIKAGRAGLKIASVPVKTIYGDEVSAINPIVDAWRFFRLVLRTLFW